MDESGPLALEILLCDPDEASASRFTASVSKAAGPAALTSERDLRQASRRLFEDSFNTIVLDPLSLGVEESAEWIFDVRRRRPEIVFALYTDLAEVAAASGHFFLGERRRLSHYFKLDKRTSARTFDPEVDALLNLCRDYLEMASLVDSERGATPLRDEQSAGRSHRSLAAVKSGGKPNTVFLSCRFEEVELVDGLQELLERYRYEVVKGDAASTYVSAAVLEAIRESQFFLSLMTRDGAMAEGGYATSAWVLEEKGAALALRKPIVLMVEEGVSHVGGLQGDWQRIPFTRPGFLRAALQAVDQLHSFSGRGRVPDLGRH